MAVVQTLKRKLARRLFRLNGPDSFPIPYWYEWNYWEPNVLAALRDLAQPGDTVYDVGANAGGLSIALSRAVGPKGIVCAFEASPRIIAKCQHNLVVNGAGNVTLYPYAVYSRSAELLEIYPGDHLNDSVMTKGRYPGKAMRVESITLDDFSERYGLTPSLIKMDIEEAEFEALKGAERLIKRYLPHLVLEQQTADTRCLDYLRALGYRAIDLSRLVEITQAQDFEPGVGIANVLYLHVSRMAAGMGYALPIARQQVAELSGTTFRPASGTALVSPPLALAPGRYYFDNEFKARGETNNAYCGVETAEGPLFRYQTSTGRMARDCRDWVVDLLHGADIRIFCRFLEGTDPSLIWENTRIYRIASLSGAKQASPLPRAAGA